MIDALCIDQQNVKEKNHQVRFMKTIYGSALHTLMWLGPAACQSDAVFDLLNTGQETDLMYLEGEPSEAAWDQESGHLGTHIEEALYHSKVHEAFRTMASWPYWYRTWILQEVVLSHYSVLMCGAKLYRWDYWTAIVRYIRFNYWGERVFVYPLKIYTLRFAEKEAPNSGPRFVNLRPTAIDQMTPPAGSDNLVKLVLPFKASGCSDVRDKAYALLGLASEKSQVPVDYGSNTATLYSQLLDVIDSYTPVQDALKLAAILGVQSSFWQLLPLLKCFVQMAILNIVPDGWPLITNNLRQRWDNYGDEDVFEPELHEECQRLYLTYYQQDDGF